MNNHSGYIALISAIVISTLLVGLTFALSYAGYFSRFNILESEYKERSLALAEACVDTALLKIAQNPGYNPSNESIPVGTDSCMVVSAQANQPVAGQTTIKTQGLYQKSYSNIIVIVNSASLVVISWNEVPNF